MPKLTVLNLFGREVFIQPDQKVLAALQGADIDWMYACGAKGRCTTCRIIVRQGSAHFSDLSPAEVKYRDAGLLHPDERLTCQCTLNGDAAGSVPDQTKFPHMDYSF